MTPHPVTTLRTALDTLDQFREVLEGQRDAWCNELELHIADALDALEMRKPLELTEAEELQARFDAVGVSLTRPGGGSAAYRRRVDQFREMVADGRWTP
jgi:hypothetical protein